MVDKKIEMRRRIRSTPIVPSYHTCLLIFKHLLMLSTIHVSTRPWQQRTFLSSIFPTSSRFHLISPDLSCFNFFQTAKYETLSLWICSPAVFYEMEHCHSHEYKHSINTPVFSITHKPPYSRLSSQNQFIVRMAVYPSSKNF